MVLWMLVSCIGRDTGLGQVIPRRRPRPLSGLRSTVLRAIRHAVRDWRGG